MTFREFLVIRVSSDIIMVMIIDSHVHLVTAEMIRAIRKRYDKLRPNIASQAMEKGTGPVGPEFMKYLQKVTVDDYASKWLSEMDKNKIDRALFLPIAECHDELLKFISLSPDRFAGYAFLDNPVEKAAAKKLGRLIGSGGLVGLKLYPSIQGVSIADKRLFPIYETAGALGIPILIHFGITHAPIADYRFTNPLDLNLPSKLFPETSFIIAHFGAGFFREILMLGFHASNIYVDTSGTNNWRLFTPDAPSLKKVFQRALDVYGYERILFGTDTIFNHKAGYRSHILKEQRGVLSKLDLKAKERKAIMGGNAARLFNL